MEKKAYKLVIYTQEGNFSLDVVSEKENFDVVIAEALDQAGTVLLDLADGGSLVLTAINTIAIAVYACADEATIGEDTPRVTKL